MPAFCTNLLLDKFAATAVAPTILTTPYISSSQLLVATVFGWCPLMLVYKMDEEVFLHYINEQALHSFTGPHDQSATLAASF